jgi:high-affinity iron transporter
MEGVIILAAAALMLYVSRWLLLRQDPPAWQAYLRQRADRALEKRTVAAVGALAFLAVFREGAETVLFIHALAQNRERMERGADRRPTAGDDPSGRARGEQVARN